MEGKIENREKHIRRFIGLTVIFFTMELILQMVLLFNGWNIVIGEITVSHFINYEVAFVSMAMIFMGVYYIKKSRI